MTGTGGTRANCQVVATSPRIWDIALNFANGDPLDLTRLAIAQHGCTVTSSETDVTIAGPLSNTGVWTAALSAPRFQCTANFSGTFGGDSP